MTKQGKQRVLAAINRLPADRPAFGELVVEAELIKACTKYNGEKDIPALSSDQWWEQEIKFYHDLGLDLVCLQESALAQPALAKRWAKEGFFVFQILNGCFQTAMQQQGFSQFMMQVARQPEIAAATMQDLSQELVAKITTDLSQWVHGIIIADDIAYQRSTYVRPSFVADYLGPCWQQQVAAAKAVDRPVFFHSDGNIDAILPAVVAAGFDGLQCIEPASGMDIAAIKQQYGERLCLMGNIDPDLLSDNAGGKLNDGNKRGLSAGQDGVYQYLTRAVNHLFTVAAPGGGFIFGTCSGLYAGLYPDKVRYMYQYARHWS